MAARRVRLLIAGPLVLAAVVGFVAFSMGRGGDSSAPATRGPAGPGLETRFAYLADQRSNRCDLQADELLSRRPGERLQGACCSPMQLHAYARQTRALHRYAAIEQIPADPYDVPVGLAQRLLRYREHIALSAQQRSIYRAAMAMSREKGPCCCRCWRWSAFEGLSRYLIARRDWDAPRLSRLIDALDGCGGDSDHS